MGTRIVTTGKEPNGLEPPGIRGIENRQAITEHVIDIKMAPIQHDLHAVGTAANIAVGQMTDLMTDPLRRNWSILRRARGGLRQQRQRCQSNQRHCQNPLMASRFGKYDCSARRAAPRRSDWSCGAH